MNKKGAELSLNVIIIAVLVIVVLIVLVIIFSTRTSIFTKTTHDTSKPYEAQTCDVPGTGRYCSGACIAGDTEVHFETTPICLDKSMGEGKCCCCKFG